MASMSPPLRVCRGILKELRASMGQSYRQSLAYNYVLDQFRKNKASLSVTGDRYCRAQQEAHHDSHTYLCLLTATRHHLALHQLYHGKGERSIEQAADMVGLRLPTQPGGKGWEK
ncbi:protein FMC1 homolog isoform X1 [Pleuronectes platessa]|uniref:protein FMC1 homolog isoform X1 n=1 Tax=Pleuronectes platessa TaxID=8262 RepID=UPI00232A0EC7|nr:protein FMC1 homolog isoform X1 [Pleuronectes platessa]